VSGMKLSFAVPFFFNRKGRKVYAKCVKKSKVICPRLLCVIMKRFIIFLLPLLCTTLFAAEADRRHVRSLAERGLFDAAEAFCHERFELPHISETDKILLAAELAHSYSLHLLLLEPAQRPRIVRRLETLERNWLAPSPASAAPDLVLAKIILRLQVAMAYRSLGDYQRLEADTASVTTRQAASLQARTTLEDALARFKQSQQELQALRQRLGFHADADLTQRMSALEATLTMQRGITQKSLAQTFSSVDDRHFELRQAAETLSGLASGNSTEPIIVQCKIEQAACYRLAGELDRCAEILTPLRTTALTPSCQLRLEAEWIRYQIALGNITETRQHYAADRENSHLHPDFDLARLELFLANNPARHISPAAPAVMRLEQAIARQFGAYWEKRAALLMLASESTDLNSAEMLAVRGDNLYREERFAEAAAFYEQAAERADANRQAETMFRYNHLAAHSWHKALEQLPPDVPRIDYQKRVIALVQKLVAQEPDHPRALEFHSLALNMQGLIVASQPEALEDYLTLLAEHTERWNDSPLLPSARRLSVIFLERQGRLDEAAAMLPLLDLEQLATLPPEIQRLRAGQLDAEGNTQEAVDILIALLNQRHPSRQHDPATLQLFAAILTRQEDAASLNHALTFWGDLESLTEKDSERWWAAREGIFVILVKLNRRDEARQSFDLLRLLYPGLGGAERKERLLKLFDVE